jgi:arylsulfatase A-like enzyme
VREPVSLLDLAPTLLDLAGVPAPPSFAGRSLVSLLEGGAAPSDERAVFAEQLWGARETLLRTQRHAWIERGQGLELYDVRQDPGEAHDLAAGEPERVADGRARLQAFREGCDARGRALGAGTQGLPVDPERSRALRALGYTN